MQGSQITDSKIINDIKYSKKKERCFTKRKNTINQKHDAQTKKAIDEASQPGASSWLSAIPLEQYGFSLAEFRDAVLIRYGKELKGLPATCPFVQKYDTTHALDCKKGGFVTICHNNIRDYETNLLAKIHTDVETEPRIQPIEGEIVNGILGDNAIPDVRARGVWRDCQNAFFDVRITNTNSAAQLNLKTEKVLLRHETEKKRGYNR